MKHLYIKIRGEFLNKKIFVLVSVLTLFVLIGFTTQTAQGMGAIVDNFSTPGDSPEGLAWDGTYLWHADYKTDKIYKLNTSGKVLKTIDAPGTYPLGLGWDGSSLWLVEYKTHKIYKLNKDNSWGPYFEGFGDYPEGLTWDGSYLWLSDSGTEKIYKVTTSGQVLKSFKTPGIYPKDLAWDGSHLWNIDSNSDKIYKLTTKGEVLENLYFPEDNPRGITWDGSHLWISVYSTKKIYKIGVNDAFSTAFSFSPNSPTVDETIKFSDQSSVKDGSIQDWSWHFGDGTTSNQQNPTHSYSNPGDYSVILKVTYDDDVIGYSQETISVNLPQYTLSTFADPSDGGNVSISPSGGVYEEGTNVTITAEPTSDYNFSHWSGDAAGRNSTIDITIDSDKSVTAHFTEKRDIPGVGKEIPTDLIALVIGVNIAAIIIFIAKRKS